MLATLWRRATTYLRDPRLADILSGSAYALGGRVVGIVLGMVFSIIVVRYYGAAMLGVLAVVNSFLMLAAILAVAGTNTALLRLIPEHITKYSYASARNIYNSVIRVVAILSTALALFGWLGADFVAASIFSKPQLAWFFALAAPLIVAYSLKDITMHAARAVRLIRGYAVLQALPHATMLVILVVATITTSRPNAPFYAQMAGWGVAAVVGLWLVGRALGPEVHEGDVVHPIEVRTIMSLATPMFVTASMQFVVGQTGVIILGILRSEAEVGYYAIAVQMATLVVFGLQAINTIAAPRFSELYHSDQLDELFYVAKKSTRLIFWSAIPVLIMLLVMGQAVIRLFYGAEAYVAYAAMVVLAVGHVVSAASGSTGYFMNMTGHQAVLRNIITAAAVLNVIVAVVLIPQFGILGAAVAASSSTITWNLATLGYMKRRFGRTTGYLPLPGWHH